MYFSIRFDKPDYGWLPMHFKSGPRKVYIDASDADGRPIYDLVMTLCNYLDHLMEKKQSSFYRFTTAFRTIFREKKIFRYWVFLEPYWQSLEFVETPNGTKFIVYSFNSPPEPRNIAFSVEGKTIEIVRKFYDALRTLEKTLTEEEWEAQIQWSWLFPHNEMARLEQLIINLESTENREYPDRPRGL